MEDGPKELGPEAVLKVPHCMDGTGSLSIASCHFCAVDIKVTYFMF